MFILFSCSVMSNSATPWTAAREASLSFTYAHSSTIYNSQDMKTTLMSLNRWIEKKKMWYMCTMGYNSAIKK